MEEIPATAARTTKDRRDLWLVLLALFAGLCVKGWLIAHTTVLTRDGVGHILLAAKLDREPWPDALISSRQHPLYSIQVLGVAKLIEAWQGRELDCLDWQLAAQWANLLAGLLLAVPMYLLGKELFGRGIGFWAALLFQVLTVPARVMADVLIEGTYLLWAATALLFAVWGLRSRSPLWFALCGLAGGLSYLARPEGAVVVLSAGLVLVAGQLVKSWKTGWTRTVACGSSLAGAALIAIVPYCWTIGGLTVKISPQQMLNPNAPISDAMENSVPLLACKQGRAPASPDTATACKQAVAHEARGGSLLLAVRFSPGAGNDVWDDSGLAPALYAVAGEIGKTFGYVLWLPALWGAFLYRRRLLADPRFAVVLAASAVQLLLIVRLAMAARYVSERHTLLIVLCGLPFAVAAVLELAARMAPALAEKKRALFAGVCLVAVIGAGLPKTLKPLHEHRKGHRAAGVWLARHWQPGDNLADPYGWVRFYSGEILHTLNKPNAVPSTGRHYMVIEPGDPDEERNRIIKTVSDRFGLGEQVYAWPDQAKPRVVVHRVEERKGPSSLVTGPVEQPHER